MKVKVGDTWYTADRRFLGVQFTREELEYIKNVMPLDEGNRKYGVGPDTDSDGATLLAWLRDEINEPKPDWHEDSL